MPEIYKIQVNKSNLSFNPLAEFMLDSLLVERVQKRVGGKVVSSLIRGIGDNSSKFIELLDDVTDKPVSDKVAGKIFDVDKEVDEIKALQKEQNTRKKEKKEISNSLINVMKSNDIDCFELNDGQLCYNKKDIKKPLTKVENGNFLFRSKS